MKIYEYDLEKPWISMNYILWIFHELGSELYEFKITKYLYYYEMYDYEYR